MKKLSVKRILTFVLAMVLCLGAVSALAPVASASTNSSVASQLSSRLPLVTYVMPLSGAAKVYSFYAHLASLKVGKGQTVSKGNKIAVVGGSGNNSNSAYGTHLHLAIVDTL